MKSKIEKASEMVLRFVIHCETGEYRISNELGLTRSESRLMKFFNFNDKQTGIELARDLSLTKSRITFLINSLLGKGLIKREPDPKDRRYLIIELTDKGKETLTALNSMTLANCTKQFDVFTEEELDCMITLLTKILGKSKED